MGDSTCTIRQAAAQDAAQMVEIYRPFIEQSCVSFELEVPTVEAFAERIAATQQRHEWLVAVDGDEVLGYAYGSPHRSREAYRFTCEVSAYTAEAARGRGVGRALYERLFEVLAGKGYCNAVAGITIPNDPSVAFHTALGFTLVGVYHRVGFKFGEWRDVSWYERQLREQPLEGS